MLLIMLQLLTPEQYHYIQPLFGEDTVPTLYCQGILAGKYPGKVIVDDLDQPQCALIIKDVWCHLIGNPSSNTFNEALKDELAEKKIIGEKNVLFFVDPSPAWLGVLAGLVENRQPIEMPRRLYAALPDNDRLKYSLPDGFELHFIDESLVADIEGELPGDVQKVLDLRTGTDVPDEMAFGFVAVNGRTIAAWSVIDFIVGNVGEIRLVTEGNYRRRGLALATSAAAITYGLAHGLTQIDWDVAASNTGSIRTAEKLGLQLIHEPKEYIIIYPEVGYFINLAWSHLDAKRFEQVHLVTEKMVTSDKEILIQYGQFLTGAAWAGLGDQAQAICHLNQAIEAGFNELGELEKCPPLKHLHKSPAWEQLVNRIQTQSEKI
jgi:RimJ/RimL family protein N-acetyltransferase